MSVEDEAAALLAKYGPGTNNGGICKVGASAHRTLIEELARIKMQSAQIARILEREKGERTAPQGIRRHARGECQCRKT